MNIDLSIDPYDLTLYTRPNFTSKGCKNNYCPNLIKMCQFVILEHMILNHHMTWQIGRKGHVLI